MESQEDPGHDACGVSIVASIDAKPSHKIVEQAIAALASVQHRGGLDTTGQTGDGAGIQLQVSQPFFQEEYRNLSGLTPHANLGVGMFFLPLKDAAARDRCQEIIANVLTEAGYENLVWRNTPVNLKKEDGTDVLGEVAAETRPHIEQLLIPQKPETSEAEFEKDLYVLRRVIEKRIQESGLAKMGSEAFYVPSMSSQQVVYKGMSLATELANLYPDLQDPRFESAYAIIHNRFSTNTNPLWPLAHPYRYVAHNGEINTVSGNRNAMAMHQLRFASRYEGRAQDVFPVILPGRSDSADVDGAVEFYHHAGLSLPAIKSLMVPEAVHAGSELSEPVRSMYQYGDAVYEPWDGPATFMMSDGNMVLAGGDRNGLRPVRYFITSDGLFFAGSEDGMVRVDPASVIERGNLRPGSMIAVDLKKGGLLRDAELKEMAAAELTDEIKLIEQIQDINAAISPATSYEYSGREQELRARQRLAGYSFEDLEKILDPQVKEGKEGLGAMGDDTPLAVLSKKYRLFSHYLFQRFAQVTNPAIDPIRERAGMSLITHLGSFYNADGTVSDKTVLRLQSPVLSNAKLENIRQSLGANIREIDCTFDVNGGESAMKEALNRIRLQSQEAAALGQHIILTDEYTDEDRAALPMILAAGAVHTHLMNEELRKQTSINVRSAECHEPHGLACLVGMGADTINPYLAEETIAARHADGKYRKPEGGDPSLAESLRKYYTSMEDGLLKVMSKMGISSVSSYRGARLFECLGLSREMLNEFLPGVESPLNGLTLNQLQQRVVKHHNRSIARAGKPTLPSGGFYDYRADGETHADKGPTISLLQEACSKGDYELYKHYAQMHEGIADIDPKDVHDLLELKEAHEPLPLDEVESEESIMTRFMASAMSIGALSPEAHDVITTALNELGGRSNSGEGGARKEFYGTVHDPQVKQFASARFGVDARYLISAKEIEIKIAQGAKPGEGGQLMGFKVQGLIPVLRNCEPGTTLISPPPMHDLYSIEDLAQMIYDLKEINPHATVRVKLVSSTGVGTIAAGVVKTMADLVHIAGGRGGTGASPRSSLKHAGLPSYEVGLTESNRALTAQNFREKTVMSADGGLRKGRDITIASLLGAEQFAFGTLPMLATGCLLMRQCHCNQCAVGVATQDPVLRAQHFRGTVDKVKNLMRFLARDTREHLARLGFRSMDEAIGRVDRLEQVKGREFNLDLSKILQPSNPNGPPQHSHLKPGERREYRHPGHPDQLNIDKQLIKDHGAEILNGGTWHFDVTNEDRTIGTRVANHLVTNFWDVALPEDKVVLDLTGVAGQSLGAFIVEGETIRLTEAANDYVGKGLSGGKIVARPHPLSPISLNPQDNIIIGNVCLIGATGGELFAAGQAGNRFAVRNSGATAVVEGMGDNGCNYVTRGTIVSLGEVGFNFGAGMTGGKALVYDPSNKLEKRANRKSVDVEPLQDDGVKAELKTLVEKHYRETGSAHAGRMLADWDNATRQFKHVKPIKIPQPRVPLITLEQQEQPSAFVA